MSTERLHLVTRIKEIETDLRHKVFGPAARAELERERQSKLDRVRALDAKKPTPALQPA